MNSSLMNALTQVIMRGTAPTSTVTSDGKGNTKESTKIVLDGLPDQLNRHNFRPESQGPSITASPTNEEFMQNPSQNKFLPTVAGNMMYGFDGTHDADLANSTGYIDVDSLQPDVMMDPDTDYQTDQYHPDLPPDWADWIKGRPVSDAAKRRRDADTLEYQQKKAEEAAKWSNDLTDPHDSDLANSTGYTPEGEAAELAAKKARINEKFKNVTGGDYSIKEVEKSIEKAGNDYQDTLLERYGDYDFAKQASEERKERLKRTNRVVMQGFMLDVMSQALGKKVGSQNYVENALKALETDFKIGNEDQLQEVTKALYFRPDGTYDPPASKDEAFQALPMMGLTTEEAAGISGMVAESKEYYVQDKSNPSGYRVVREKPGGDTEYTTNASVANNKWGIDVNATSQTAENALNMRKKQQEIFQKNYPKVDGFFVNPKNIINALSTSGTLTQNTIDNMDPKSVMQLEYMVRTPQFGLSKDNVVEVDASQLEEMDKNFGNGEYYVAIVTDPQGGKPQLKERYGSGQ